MVKNLHDGFILGSTCLVDLLSDCAHELMYFDKNWVLNVVSVELDRIVLDTCHAATKLIAELLICKLVSSLILLRGLLCLGLEGICTKH